MKNKNRLEYVMSGCGYARLGFEEAVNDIELNKWINQQFSKLNTGNHKFSLLYNAYTEKNMGENISKGFRESIHNIHADSGGLQIITRGLGITDELKQKIYLHQAKNSDVAMSFDEIPLRIAGDASKRGSTNCRLFDPTLIEDSARTSGKNLKTQIELFIEEKTTAKPFLIIQGNCIETYQKWCDYILKEIPSEYYSYIGGIAISSACLGNRIQEDIEKAFVLTQLPLPFDNNHFHILGIGTIIRLLPSLIMINNGTYKDIHLSYDSTTHTSNSFRGIMLGEDGKNVDFPRTFCKNIHPLMHRYADQYFETGIDLNEYHIALNAPSLKFKEMYGSRNNLIKTNISTILTSVKHFKDLVDVFVEEPELMFNYLGEIKDSITTTALRNFHEVTTIEDFRHWQKTIGKYLETGRVRDQEAANLMELF